MNEIKNALLCGLGGLGSICAVSIKDSCYGSIKVLVDETRYEQYKENPPYVNDRLYDFDYVLPSNETYKADIVIIATKNNGLNNAIKNTENFVHEDTVFISLLNGIDSEEKIAEKYSDKNVITSFYIGHSCVREGRKVYQDGIYELVTGIQKEYQKQALLRMADFFKKTNIHYRISENITDEYWKKFMINTGINQVSAVTGKSLKEIKEKDEDIEFLKRVMYETALIAEKTGIKNYKNIYDTALHFLLFEIDEAIPSMLQDIRANRPTEVDIFAGEIIRLGAKYGIQTPENERIYNKIKLMEAAIAP